ncbi:hypothetical protein HIM_09902 [Hirsutella minnesotensis 3608]|uniref:Endonuclease/exonuclease/phosphatase domain-containing protein n=1 Tax=Hirsutella minnesotensis 3608 TaxID=1043627 RepID=A0A0F7ZS44_9HYPO|nr:hypothetical protein HIM_09902 [Hirsutella minnesotensis 3608]
MHKTLSILQLNVRKREPVQQSLMNDEDLKDYGVLAVSEPYARVIDGKVVTSPMMHNNWMRILPTHMSDGPWPIRSMLWVRDDVEVVQMPIPSADLTAAVLRLPERSVLVVSVYVEGQSTEALKSTTGLLHDLIQRFRQGSGARTDVVLAGDFNSHDLLWGGDDVSVQRQGEAGPIIDLMNEHGLRSLLPRGTKTWQRKDQESTIDLVLTSELADEVATCAIHPTDHGSDHRAIQTTFDITMPERSARPRLLFKKNVDSHQGEIGKPAPLCRLQPPLERIRYHHYRFPTVHFVFVIVHVEDCSLLFLHPVFISIWSSGIGFLRASLSNGRDMFHKAH